jgi:4-diphosphocytidyl-2-C-methyl-D-erythritol kinase
MPTRVRSYSKINLGLAIGPSRPDGFHGLTTLYQTIELHDLVTVEAAPSSVTRITLTSNDRRVPLDQRNTAWKMVERALAAMGRTAEVAIHIDKRLPVQGGMGAGSANAAAALIGLERELDAALPGPMRLQLAAEVGSDVPLFLLGGSVLGLGRGEQVYPMPDDLPAIHCVIAVPGIGVSTPQAFRDWDQLIQGLETREQGPGVAGQGAENSDGLPFPSSPQIPEPSTAFPNPSALVPGPFPPLTPVDNRDRLAKLSLAYASLYAEPGTSGIFRHQTPGNLQDRRTEDLAENTLLALVRTGVENDFEQVVFPAYPSLREIKRQLMGTAAGSDSEAALYAALSGSGSALFGLYRSEADARAAQRRVQAIPDAEGKLRVNALITKTLPRGLYWKTMFAG